MKKSVQLKLQKRMQKKDINYKQLFCDILEKKHPEKKQECLTFLDKFHSTAIDIIQTNEKIFDTGLEEFSKNQRLRSYSETDISLILAYQKKKELNNSQLANHFNISRNTISKWRKLFCA